MLVQFGVPTDPSEEISVAPVEPTGHSEASVQSTYYCLETMSSAQQPSLQHWKNRCPIGASVGAMTSARKEECNGYVKIKCHRFNRRQSIDLTDGPRVCCGSVREANGYFRAQCDQKNRCPSTGSFDAYTEKCPTAPNG